MLSEFPREQVFKQRMQLSNVDLDRWMDEFEQGAIGAIVGIYQLPQAKAPMNAERFRELWGIAESIYWSSTISKEAIPQDANPLVAAAYKAYSSPDSRVFISYTRQDAREAEILRQALEQQGYFVFTYLKGGGNEFNVTAREAGEYFAHAGVRLVLDSQNARQSVGVAFEARFDEVISAGQYPRGNAMAETIRTFGDTKKYTILSRPLDDTKYSNLKPPFWGPGGIILGAKPTAEPDVKPTSIKLQPTGHVLLETAEHGTLSMPAVNRRLMLACAQFATSEDSTDTLISWLGDEVSVAEDFSHPNLIAQFATADKVTIDSIKIRPTENQGLRATVMDESVGIKFNQSGVEFLVKLKVKIAGNFLIADLIVGADGVSSATIPSPHAIDVLEFNRLAAGLEPALQAAGWIGFFRWLDSNQIDLRQFKSDLRNSVDGKLDGQAEDVDGTE